MSDTLGEGVYSEKCQAVRSLPARLAGYLLANKRWIRDKLAWPVHIQVRGLNISARYPIWLLRRLWSL